MALLDMRGVLRRCPQCDTAVAEDARRCVACGATLEEASRKPGGQSKPGPGVQRPLLGSSGIPFLGLGAGSGRVSAAISEGATRFEQVIGEALVRLLGMKTGAAALDENPWRVDGSGGAGLLLRRRLFRLLLPYRTGLSDPLRIRLFRDLAKYAESGIGFHDALARLQNGTKSPVLARLLSEVRKDLLEGSTLRDAFGKHGYLFEPIEIALLEVGESLGTLGDNMRQLIEIAEERRALRRQIGRKLVQPIGLIFIANYVITLSILLFAGPLEYLKTIAVPTALILFGASFFLVVLPVLAEAAGRGVTDRLKLEVPAFGTVARTNALARFTRALGAAISAGVEIDRALKLSARASDNVVVERAILTAIPQVKADGLARGLQEAGVLEAEVAADLAHGETTGTLGATLATISKDARERAARGTAILGSILSFALLALSALYCVFSVFTKALSAASTAGPLYETPSWQLKMPWER